MGSPVRRATPARYEDLYGIPDTMVAEILDGELHATPRPRGRHARSSSTLGMSLGGPFDLGRGGPGGWIILDEPELELGADVVVPDLAGWRRERFARVPAEDPIKVPPDWVCEVISPTTERTDRTTKRDIYAREGVGHLWFVVPLAKTLEAYALEGGRWVLLGSYAGEMTVAVRPFDAVGLELGLLWADIDDAS